MMSGLEEGLSMTIAVTADMVIDTHRREKTEDNVEERMEAKLKLGYGIFKWFLIYFSFISIVLIS